MKLKKTMSIFLVVFLILGLMACNKSDKKPTNSTVDKPTNSTIEKPSDSEAEEPSDSEAEEPSDSEAEEPSDSEAEEPSDSEAEEPSDSEAEEPSDNTTDNSDAIWREEYVSQEEKEAALVDEDHIFKYQTENWKGPKGYVIVVPNGNSSAKKTAESLQSYYEDTAKVTLKIVTDKSGETDKEILIGKTSRKESASDMKESDLKVSLNGNKLVFDGGHDVTVDSAVKKFIRLAPKAGEAFTFSLSTDFKTTALDGYKYVWGDEFEDTDVDFTKWDFAEKMTAMSVRAETAYSKDVINVSDGRLKLNAIRCFNPEAEGVQFRMPYSVNSEYHMNWVYGYAEIRARIPTIKGTWPSYWTQTTDALSGYRNPECMVEVDIFEGFGLDYIIPGLHRWYTWQAYNKYYGTNLTSGSKTAATNKTGTESNQYVWDSNKDKEFAYEYHIHGYEWTPTEIKISIDGVVYNTYDIVNSYDKNPDMTAFHDPQFIIFNNHISLSDTGSFTLSVIDGEESLLPACYYIDYFRLYQKPGVGKLYIDESDPKYYPGRD